MTRRATFKDAMAAEAILAAARKERTMTTHRDPEQYPADRSPLGPNVEPRTPRKERTMNATNTTTAALAALDAGDPAPVLDAVAAGIIPPDAPVAEKAAVAAQAVAARKMTAKERATSKPAAAKPAAKPAKPAKPKAVPLTVRGLDLDPKRTVTGKDGAVYRLILRNGEPAKAEYQLKSWSWPCKSCGHGTTAPTCDGARHGKPHDVVTAPPNFILADRMVSPAPPKPAAATVKAAAAKAAATPATTDAKLRKPAKRTSAPAADLDAALDAVDDAAPVA